MKSSDIKSFLIRFFIKLSGIITFLSVSSIVVYVIFKGITNINLDMFSVKYTTKNASMLPAIINTFEIVIISLIISLIIGIFTAVYLCQYTNKNSWIVNIINITIETLAGIPSIVYGLFGYLAFVVFLNFGYSIIAGALTLSIMVLPIIIRTTQEAIISVDNVYIEGSYALGAGKLRTIFSVILPAVRNSIISAMILATGRMVGETAALLYTSGSASNIASDPLKSGRTLSVHMYALLSEGMYTKQAYATSVILLLLIITVNFAARHFLNEKNL